VGQVLLPLLQKKRRRLNDTLLFKKGKEFENKDVYRSLILTGKIKYLCKNDNGHINLEKLLLIYCHGHNLSSKILEFLKKEGPGLGKRTLDLYL